MQRQYSFDTEISPQATWVQLKEKLLHGSVILPTFTYEHEYFLV